MTFTRIGIYVTPRPGPFARAGAEWLGWDSSSAASVGNPDLNVVARPQKYGFHGTIKPPFVVAEGTSVDAVKEKLMLWCAHRAPVTLHGLKITRLGSFLAFTPSGDVSDLAKLASAAVRAFDPFRAPPTKADLEKRRRPNMTPDQLRNIERWGYPHVLESFRFHMTITGPLPRTDIERVQAQAQAYFADLVPEPFEIDALTLVGERQDGMFCEIARCPLKAATSQLT